MGQKVHPVGLRLGIIKGWQSRWYAEGNYAELLHEDLRIRKIVREKYPGASVSRIEIDRAAKEITVTVYTARPGIVIGRGGQRVDELRGQLGKVIKKPIQINVQEIRQPWLDAYLVAVDVAEQLERRMPYRRILKRTVSRTRELGAKGIKITVAGRLGGAEIARSATLREGQVPLHTLRADIDYGFTEARTLMGRIGVKVWIYKDDILPEPKVAEIALPPADIIEPAEKIVVALPIQEQIIVEPEKVAEDVTTKES